MKLKKNHLNRFVLFAKTEDFQSYSSFFPTPNILTKKKPQICLRLFHHLIECIIVLCQSGTTTSIILSNDQTIFNKISIWERDKKTKLICVCISLSLMSFVTPQPSQSEKILEFSRLKLETKATPTKAACCHAPSHKQNKQTKKKEAKIHSS